MSDQRHPVGGGLDLASWLEAYGEAWREADADAVAELFTEDAVYRSAPLREPHVGRDGVRRYWREEPMRHEEIDLRFGKPVISGRRAAVEWWVTVLQDGEAVTGPGCLVVRFDERGLCEELREYWDEKPGWTPPPEGWGD